MRRRHLEALPIAALLLMLGTTGSVEAQSVVGSTHWAFVPPERVRPPEVENRVWSRSEIDRFVFARLSRAGLKPSPPADRTTLLRRLTFDLTGLPPTLEELDAFESANTAGAWTRQVERLLDSPHHAERMALSWMDAARYADTNGFSIDGGRHMWAWRDRVIESFRTNMPFDQFTIEQLAGDLLPNATIDQKVASGFNRNHMITHEGGALPSEYRVKYVVDRVKTTASVWMGLTMGCAQCHDHKYDPITQEDYYRFYAFLNTITDKGIDGDGGKNAAPFVTLDVASQVAQAKTIAADLFVLWTELTRMTPEKERAMAIWETELRTEIESTGTEPRADPVLELSRVESLQGAELSRLDDGSWLASGRIPNRDTYTLVAETDRRRIAGLLLEVMADDSLPSRGPGRITHGNFVLTAFKVTLGPVGGEGAPRTLEFRTPTSSHSQSGFPSANALDGGLSTGWAIAPRAGENHWARFVMTEPIRLKGRTRLTIVLDQQFGTHHVIGRFRVRLLTGPAAVPEGIRKILAIDPQQRTRAQRTRIWNNFLAASRHFRPQREAIAAHRRGLKEAQIASSTTVMVMEEMAEPRETFRLKRGQYDRPAERVTAGTPTFLPPMAETSPRNRLGLARWLVSPKHPLTARVTINRLWQMLFGTGLVATPGDFGVRGARPSHPELLDWLATELIRRQWDLRAMIRLIVNSETYRQASQVTPTTLERDPRNRLLARGSVFRLQAEFIRDNALAASDLLVRTIGGPSVKPYQPPGLWQEMSLFGNTPATAQRFVQDQGFRLYRRSLYTFWKRSSPPPNMTVFDAPNRETCTLQRHTTNTPLQALVLLNDPTFVEAARALAQRTMLEVPRDSSARVEKMFRRVTSRRPTPSEKKVLLGTLERGLLRFRGNAEAARRLLNVGDSKRNASLDLAEHAAWLQVASLILNLSETVTRN